MDDPLCIHKTLTAIEDRGLSLRWRCECGWQTDSMRGPGEQVGDKCEMKVENEAAA